MVLLFGISFLYSTYFFGLSYCMVCTLLENRSVHQLLLILSVYLPICLSAYLCGNKIAQKRVKNRRHHLLIPLESPCCSSVYLYICYLTNKTTAWESVCQRNSISWVLGGAACWDVWGVEKKSLLFWSVFWRRGSCLQTSSKYCTTKYWPNIAR